MLLLGIDLGTSSIKVSVIDADTQQILVSVQYPDTENPVITLQTGWAEQSPDTWWNDVQQAILKAHASKKYDPIEIGAIGIAYQMHGLVMVDKDQVAIRNSIIWCDSRAVEIGNDAFRQLGEKYCLERLLNSPGNFTASKLKWVKDNEPASNAPATPNTATPFPSVAIDICIVSAPFRTSNKSRQPGLISSSKASNSVRYRSRQRAG